MNFIFKDGFPTPIFEAFSRPPVRPLLRWSEQCPSAGGSDPARLSQPPELEPQDSAQPDLSSLSLGLSSLASRPQQTEASCSASTWRGTGREMKKEEAPEVSAEPGPVEWIS